MLQPDVTASGAAGNLFLGSAQPGVRVSSVLPQLPQQRSGLTRPPSAGAPVPSAGKELKACRALPLLKLLGGSSTGKGGVHLSCLLYQVSSEKKLPYPKPYHTSSLDNAARNGRGFKAGTSSIPSSPGDPWKRSWKGQAAAGACERGCWGQAACPSIQCCLTIHIANCYQTDDDKSSHL